MQGKWFLVFWGIQNNRVWISRVQLYKEIPRIMNCQFNFKMKRLLPFQGSTGSVGPKGYRGDSGEEVMII